MYNPKYLHTFFDGFRTNVWIILAITHGIVVPLTTDALTFNPILGAWLFSPHVGYPQPDYKKKCSNNLSGSAISLADAPIFFQVLILSLLNFFVATVYCYLQSFPIPVIVMKITHMGWLCNHGLPSIINITLNATIRKEVFKVLKIQKYRYLFTSSTAPMQSVTANLSTPAPA
uniref:Uncharacterized protein n=1 Tax=Panagrolaimus davidi TaxID=227884 RepID=A0A914QZ14_9BILA